VKFRFNILVCVLLQGSVSASWAGQPVDAASPAQVLVVGNQTDIAARRDFVAGKIIIGRKRIEESGVRTVEDLLRREPAVTVRDGRIGLLNMPGYTQVLVDGHPPEGGRTPSQLDLVHVEKIEIIKSSVAEYGPYGIAGTINIVTRKMGRKTETRMTAGLARNGGKPGTSASLSHNQSREGSLLRYSVQLSADESNTSEQSVVRQTTFSPLLAELEQSRAVIRSENRVPMLIVGGNLTWQAGADETIVVSPDGFRMGGGSKHAELRHWAGGTTLDASQQSRSRLSMYALPVKWTFKPDKKSQVEMSFRVHRADLMTAVERTDRGSSQERIVRESSEHSKARSSRLELIYKKKLNSGHDVKVGVSVSRNRQDVVYDYLIDGTSDDALGALGSGRRSLGEQRRIYVQDEWRISDSVALNAGVSGENAAIDVAEGPYQRKTQFRLWSPSLHLSKKIGADDDRQLRVSIARSFKAPTADQFTLRPEINALAPCLAGGLCTANTIDTADTSGNVDLQAERAIGLNLAYEHGIGADSQLTLEVYTRQIDRKIGTAITLENVTWSLVPRYVSHPVNFGDARSSGINVEMELALRDVYKSAPKITISGSVGLASSSVSSLPGPDNRLDKQTPWTAKLAASYSMKNWPVKFDIDGNWSPATTARTSLWERAYAARSFDFDASATWSISKERRIIFDAKARSPRNVARIDEYLRDAEQVRIYTGTRKNTKLGLRFETKL
jgi:outer membrane receptor for ferrienterochelin and colicins